MGKVCALLWVAFVLLTTRLPPLTDGCGITASVSLINGDNRVAEEGGTLVLYWHSVVLIWCRNATPTHSIYHDDTLVFTTSPEFPLYELEEFGVEQQGVYRCDCGSGRNSLNLVLLIVPGIDDARFVGTAKEGDTVHLPCQLTNIHPNLSSLYLVEWRQDGEDIVYGNKYSKLPNNSLVIKDFDKEDTEKRFYCHVGKIGNEVLQLYSVWGLRVLLMLEMPNVEILLGDGTVNCSASTPFDAFYCLTITYSDGQRMTMMCESNEVKIQTSGTIKNIICTVTVFSNASVPQSFLHATNMRSSLLNAAASSSVNIALIVSLPLVSTIILSVLMMVLILCCCYKYHKCHKYKYQQKQWKTLHKYSEYLEQVDGEESTGGQGTPEDAGTPVAQSSDSSCTAFATVNSRPTIPGGSAPSSLAAPLPTDSVQRQFFIRIPSAKKMGSRERPVSPTESIHDYVAPLQCSLKRQRPTHLKCNLMVYSEHTLPSPPVVPQQPALPAPVVVHIQTGSNVDQLWPRTPPNWPLHSSRLNTPQNRPAKVSPLALRSQTSVTAEDCTFYAELTPLPQRQEMQIQSNPVAVMNQQPCCSDDGITSEEWGEWLKVGHNLWHSDVSDVVRVQSGKSPEVISTTAEVLRRHGCEEESTLLAGQDLLKFQQQYSEVVRNQATITVKITKCTTIGPPRMGKTCFKHLITGQEWDVEAGTASTDIMEAPEWVECYSLEDGGADKPWKLLSAEQQQGELIRAVHTLTITGTHLTTTTSDVQHPAIPSDIPTTTSPSDAHHVSTTSDAQHPTTPSDVRAIDAPTTTSPSDVQQSVIIPSDTPTTSPSDAQQSMAPDDAQTTTSPNDPQHPTTSYVTQTTTTPSDAQHSFTPSDVPLRTKPDAAQKPATVWQALEALAGAVNPKAVQDFLKDSAGKVLGETRLIHFVDTGGQSVYHDVHPVLITSPSVYVVVFNLHDLYQKSNEEQLQYFRSDLIQRPLRSIYTFGTKNPQEKHLRVSPEGPTIFIVGTHLDKIPEKDRKGILSTLHVMISTEIGNKPYRQFVRYDTEGQSFWAVDNTLAGREQEEEVKKSFKYISALRLMVQNRSLEMSVDIPLPWMLLKVVMEGKGVRYCKYSELMEVACERGYVRETSPEADLDSMLRLFHILSLFYHKVPKGYKKEDSLVFIHPDCLYSVTSDFLMAAKEEVKENCEERCQLQAAVMAMNDSQGDSEQRLNQALAANEEDTEDSRGSSEEKQQSQAATKNLTATKEDICYGAQLAEGIMVRKERILERMRGNMKIIEQERVKMVQKVEGIMARLGPESTEVVLERLYAELIEIGQKYKLPSMEFPDASSQEAKRQLFVSRLVNSLASSVRAVLCDPERKGDVPQVRKEVAKAMKSMKTQCQRRSIDSSDMDQLLAILSDLRIVAQLNDSSSLVIPAALPEVPHSMDIVGTVDPLLVTVVSQTVLQVCYLPSGLFCCLISELVTGLHWTVVPLGHTHVAFTHKNLTGRVHVTEYKSYIKIDLESQAALEELSETCQNVREMIHESIVSVYSNLLSDPTAGPAFEESLIWGFQCEEHPGDDTHIAAFYEDDDKFDCCAKCLNDMDSFAVQGVKPEQLVWFSS